MSEQFVVHYDGTTNGHRLRELVSVSPSGNPTYRDLAIGRRHQLEHVARLCNAGAESMIANVEYMAARPTRTPVLNGGW